MTVECEWIIVIVCLYLILDEWIFDEKYIHLPRVTVNDVSYL